jgi:predicted dehydrogenase
LLAVFLQQSDNEVFMYNVGIIGLGQIAYSIDNDPARKITWSHINAYKKSKDTQVISICDIDETQVKKISQECDIYSGYTDYREMLKNEDLDIVSICTPINTHVQIIKDCIKQMSKLYFVRRQYHTVWMIRVKSLNYARKIM